MSFKQGFEKEAFVGLLARGALALARPVAGLALKGAKVIGKGAVKAMGGPLNAAATAAGAASDAGEYSKKLKAAREGLT